MNFETFLERLDELGIVVSKEMKQQFLVYKNLIQEVNKVLNLTAIDDDQGIYLKHFWDSLLINPYIEENAKLCDVGSGAGFPGIVIAIARPDVQVVCVEPTGKRSDFLKRVAKECSLNNVTVINDRAEHVVEEKRESFDVVTARAVAYLDILSELCIPLVKLNGVFIAMKGSKGMDEWRDSAQAVKMLGGELVDIHHEEDEIMGERHNLVIKKIVKTKKKYPRSYAKIKKTPLSGRKHE